MTALAVNNAKRYSRNMENAGSSLLDSSTFSFAAYFWSALQAKPLRSSGGNCLTVRSSWFAGMGPGPKRALARVWAAEAQRSLPLPRKNYILFLSLQICYNERCILGRQKTIKVLHCGCGKTGGQFFTGGPKMQAGHGKKNPQLVETADGDTVDNRFCGPKNRLSGNGKLFCLPVCSPAAGDAGPFFKDGQGVFPLFLPGLSQPYPPG